MHNFCDLIRIGIVVTIISFALLAIACMIYQIHKTEISANLPWKLASRYFDPSNVSVQTIAYRSPGTTGTAASLKKYLDAIYIIHTAYAKKS
jgi:hypothetical protein